MFTCRDFLHFLINKTYLSLLPPRTMKDRRSSILFLITTLLLVFLTPLVVKSFHTLEDHVHHHDCCQSSALPLAVGPVDDYCPIHEYEISTNEIPDLQLPEYSFNFYRELIVLASGQLIYRIPDTLFSPRAPPAFS